MLQVTYARQRQQRLLAVLQAKSLDAVVLGSPHHVQWASAHRPFWLKSGAFMLLADGRSWLATAKLDTPAEFDEVVLYPSHANATLRMDQPLVLAERILAELAFRKAKRIGLDASAVSAAVAMSFAGETLTIEPDLWQLRRAKDPDELMLIERAVAAAAAMYARAKQVVEPGIPELAVFSALQAAAVESLGEPMDMPLGNDFASGVPGGPAREGHVAQAGQIYILDVSPNYRGYFADTSRCFSVDRKPTHAQYRAHEALLGVFPLIEAAAKPGVRCHELVHLANAHLEQTAHTVLTHHLGHGVGLQPHEFPHLNLDHWDDTLVEGDVFTVEPGVYRGSLNGGLRLENMYLVTATGLRNLVDVPMELV